MVKSLCCLRLIALMLWWFSCPQIITAVSMQTCTIRMRMTNNMISSINEDEQCAWFQKVFEQLNQHRFLHDQFERLLFPRKFVEHNYLENTFVVCNFNENTARDYLSDRSKYFCKENIDRSLFEVEISKLICTNTDVRLIDHLDVSPPNVLYDYEFERQRRRQLLIPIFRRLLYLSKATVYMCTDQFDIKCRLLAFIHRINDDDISYQTVHCRGENNYCMIESSYHSHPGLKKTHTFCDNLISDPTAASLPILKLNADGRFELWEDYERWIFGQ
ncbi:uncharacterized protein LOC126839581 [Adelges cooleyi]|uniref:uncharacterized protein LOC126839581 n=1 Tax=Adelges cooleyi TaxID=133065 RepID=UPI00217FA543|nr:uncharacterized protein LOC126839581 [Adelges cooleyi]